MPLRPSGLQPESAIYIGDVVVGDFIFINIRSQQVLNPEVYKEDGVRKQRWVIESMMSTRRGTAVTQAQGVVAVNDVSNEEVIINVGGRHAYRSSTVSRPSLAILPWSAIQVAYITRPRLDLTDLDNPEINQKFPRKIPVSFDPADAAVPPTAVTLAGTAIWPGYWLARYVTWTVKVYPKITYPNGLIDTYQRTVLGRFAVPTVEAFTLSVMSDSWEYGDLYLLGTASLTFGGAVNYWGYTDLAEDDPRTGISIVLDEPGDLPT